MINQRDVYLSVNCRTLGDTLCATPSLRKMFFVYNKKINVVVPDETKRIWINNPYIDKLYSYEEFKDKFKNKDWNYLNKWDTVQQCRILSDLCFTRSKKSIWSRKKVSIDRSASNSCK